MDHDELQRVMTDAAEEIVAILLTGLENDDGVSPAEAITAAAALAGCFLLKDSHSDLSRLSPGSAVFVEELNDMGPRLLTVMQQYAAGFGLDGERGWDSTVPQELVPQNVYPLLLKFEPEVAAVCDRRGLPSDLRAGLLAFTAVRFIAESKEYLPEAIGKSLALSAMIAGSKTVPPRP